MEPSAAAAVADWMAPADVANIIIAIDDPGTNNDFMQAIISESGVDVFMTILTSLIKEDPLATTGIIEEMSLTGVDTGSNRRP